MKKRLRSALAALLLPLALLSACQQEQTLKVPDTSSAPVQGQDSSSQGPDASTAPAQPLELTPDLNRNGIPEEVRLVGTAWGNTEVQFFENGGLVNREFPGVCLCTLDGEDYILRYHVDDEYPGAFRYDYDLARFSGEPDDLFPEETAQWGRIDFDLSFGAPFHRDFDPEAVAAFVEEVNELLSHSVRLDERDGALLVEDNLTEELDFLDSFPAVFVRDPEKSLLENLEAFQAAMTQACPPAQPGEPGPLPLEEPLELYFASGAGAWSTWLHLEPDGAFRGVYTDDDMGVTGEGYPNGTRYVCTFHGSFGPASRLTSASWLLSLEELVLDTGHPVEEEWIEDGVRCISSEPYGLNGADGTALEPGARFVLCSPEATGHAPGTELYGAYEFWSWWPARHGLAGPSDTLNCWGLHNLETGCGFFS